MQWVSRNTPKTIPRVCLPRSEPCRDLSLFPSRELWRGTLDFEVSPTYPPADNPDCGACVEFAMARRWLCVTIDNWWLIINDWLCLFLIMRMKLYWSECEKGFFLSMTYSYRKLGQQFIIFCRLCHFVGHASTYVLILKISFQSEKLCHRIS